MDGIQGQAPVVTSTTTSPITTLSQPLPITTSTIPISIQVPLAGLEVPSLSSTTSSAAPPAAAPLKADQNSTDRPDGPAGMENNAPAAQLGALAKETIAPKVETTVNTITNGSNIPSSAPQLPSSLPAQQPVTLNANAVNAAGEAEHAARVEQEAKNENAILAADDQVKQEQEQQQDESSSLQGRQRTPLTDLSLAQTNATVAITAAAAAANTEEETPRSPPSPSSTSALSSVAASAAPSVINQNTSTKNTPKEEEEGAEHADSDRKPRSTGGRSTTARRAASNANLKETAAVSSSSSSATTTRRSEKPASTSSNSRTRGASAQGQGQPQRQSSRSKTTTTTTANGSTSIPTTTSSNTRPRMRQRGSPDNKDGNENGTIGTRRSRRTRQSTAQNGRAAGEEEESDDGDEGVTRCVCGNNDDETSAFMIQCDTCKAWQHGPCVGFKYEHDTPDTYFCEQCRPELHPSLSASRGKKHARSVSASSRPANSYSNGNGEKDDSLRRSTSRDHLGQQQHHSASAPTTATSSVHPSYHRARSSADAAIINSFLETPHHGTTTPPLLAAPASPGSPGGSSDGGTKRPMYPSTSHFAAPQNPKRRSTMNSRDSAAFDESILLATQRAFRESRAMAMSDGKGGSGGSSKARKRKVRDGGDDDMEPVKEEEEDHSDRGMSSSAQPEEADQHRHHHQDERTTTNGDGTLDKSNIDPTLANNEEEEGEGEGDEDADDQDEMSTDMNGNSAPRKRRRRRGAGALFTAPNKKRAATARSKKGTNEGTDGAQSEDLAVNSPHLGDLTSATEDEANARKRKRDDANEDDGRSGRAISPTASHDTSIGSHSSSDKPLAQGNKRRKASPSDAQGEADTATASTSTSATASQTVTNILGSTLQVAIPTFTEDSAAPSPAASLPPGQGEADESSKEQEHADAITNGLLAVNSGKGKRAAETDQEESTPAPTAQGDDSTAATALVNGKVVKQPNQYTYKRGGPGSRGGLKGSPSKRAALAAASEARHGKHRDETPSTYEDWINAPPSWGIPDHLSHLSHLLPSQSPLPLQVAKFFTSPNASAAASPITPQGEAGTADQATVNGESTPSTPAITVSSTLEPSAKIRFPSRRMSIAEMRKRAKSMLDYLARVQVDTVDRNNRNRALAAVQESILESELKDRNLTPPPSMRFSKDSPLTPQATTLLDDLSRQLNSFQDKFL